MDDGLTFVVYDRTSAFVRQIGAHGGAHATLTRNVIPTAEFMLDDDDAALPGLTAKGARCAVWFRGVERFRGKVNANTGDGPEGQVTVKVLGDLRKLWEWQGWPVPANAIGSQTSDVRLYTGRTEQVFKAALGENVTRLGVPWTVVSDHGYGTGGQRVEFRFHPLGDKLVPPLETDGLIITITYDGFGHPVVDVRQPATITGVLSPLSGVIDKYTYDMTSPTLTRVIVGGAGDGAARELAQYTSSTRESDWGDIIEGFVDARNATAGADLSPDGAQALADGADRVGLNADLLESDLLRYGTTYDVGDVLHVQVGPVDVTVPIMSVQIDDTADQGVLVTPKLGTVDVAAPTEVLLARQIAKLAAGARDQGRR